jgi:hypothetical protein
MPTIKLINQEFSNLPIPADIIDLVITELPNNFPPDDEGFCIFMDRMRFAMDRMLLSLKPYGSMFIAMSKKVGVGPAALPNRLNRWGDETARYAIIHWINLNASLQNTCAWISTQDSKEESADKRYLTNSFKFVYHISNIVSNPLLEDTSSDLFFGPLNNRNTLANFSFSCHGEENIRTVLDPFIGEDARVGEACIARGKSFLGIEEDTSKWNKAKQKTKDYLEYHKRDILLEKEEDNGWSCRYSA